jgi:hypothetical protein
MEGQWVTLLINRTCILWSFCTNMCIVDLSMEEKPGEGTAEQWEKCHSTFQEGGDSDSHQILHIQCSCREDNTGPYSLQWVWESSTDSYSSCCSRQGCIKMKIHTSVTMCEAMGLAEVYFPRVLGLRIRGASPLSYASLCQTSFCHVVCRWGASPLSRLPWVHHSDGACCGTLIAVVLLEGVG